MKCKHERNLLLVVLTVLMAGIHAAPPSAEAIFGRIFGRRPSSNNVFFNPGFQQFGFPAFQRFPSVIRRNGNLTTNFARLEGFSHVVRVGRTLFERNSVTGDLFRLTLFDNGVLAGATELNTIQELVNFYTKNRFDNQGRPRFNGRDAVRVNNFLLRYGGFSNGQFVFNMNVATSVTPDEIKKMRVPDGASAAAVAGWAADPELELNVNALNFLLNDVSQSGALIRTDEICRPGQGEKEVACDLRRFFRQDALNLIAQSDPLASCTGGRIRLNAAVVSLTDTNNYYRMIQAPTTKDQFALDYGISNRKEGSLRNKIVVADRYHRNKEGDEESGVVTSERRLIEYQPINRFVVRSPADFRPKVASLRQGNSIAARGICYGSYDVKSQQDPREEDARDIFLKGITFNHDAEEWLCMAPNGMSWRRYLFNGDGAIQTEAPISIVRERIEAGRDCLRCHNTPVLGGGAKKSRDRTDEYHDHSGDVPHHQGHFTNNKTYRVLGDDMDQLMLGNQRDARARIDMQIQPKRPDAKGKLVNDGEPIWKPFPSSRESRRNGGRT